MIDLGVIDVAVRHEPHDPRRDRAGEHLARGEPGQELVGRVMAEYHHVRGVAPGVAGTTRPAVLDRIAQHFGAGVIVGQSIDHGVERDEPGGGQYYGGSVAAPVFARVMEGALRALGVPPDAPMKAVVLPAPGEEVPESI